MSYLLCCTAMICIYTYFCVSVIYLVFRSGSANSVSTFDAVPALLPILQCANGKYDSWIQCFSYHFWVIRWSVQYSCWFNWCTEYLEFNAKGVVAPTNDSSVLLQLLIRVSPFLFSIAECTNHLATELSR